MALYRALETVERRRPPLFHDPYATRFLSPGLSRAVREGIRTEFAHVTNLPSLFNSADVVAEQCLPTGLREVFADTCQRGISGPRRPREHRLYYGPNDTTTQA